jgi:KUP system potassium uptake protein
LSFHVHYSIVQCTRTSNGDNLSEQHKKSSLAALTLAAVGIVYGDIGTSPLYTLKTIFDPTTGWR